MTEATTLAKKGISDYGKKYRPLKWISIIVAIGCIIALIAVNVRYRKKYGKKGGNMRRRPTPPNNNQFRKQANKQNSNPKLDTSARFDRQNKRDENLEKTTVVDISSFKKQNNQPPKPKNDDDDLYI